MGAYNREKLLPKFNSSPATTHDQGFVGHLAKRRYVVGGLCCGDSPQEELGAGLEFVFGGFVFELVWSASYSKVWLIGGLEFMRAWLWCSNSLEVRLVRVLLLVVHIAAHAVRVCLICVGARGWQSGVAVVSLELVRVQSLIAHGVLVRRSKAVQGVSYLIVQSTNRGDPSPLLPNLFFLLQPAQPKTPYHAFLYSSKPKGEGEVSRDPSSVRLGNSQLFSISTQKPKPLTPSSF
ncbi:hypothetical protein Drorol1_Dr00017627 [Drosera rotundifolia]